MPADEIRDLKVAAIAAALVLCAVLRVIGIADPGPVELLPVLAAAVWFGRRAGLIAASIASLALAVTALGVSDPGYQAEWVILRVALLLLAGDVVGRLTDRTRAQARELERIRPLQDVLAPSEPAQPALVEMASRYITADGEASGDFYLVTEGRNNATVVVVGDVAGKGVEAARRATFVRATITACAPYSEDPAHILRTANAELIRQYGPSAQFITVLCGVVHPDATFTWASAGHPPPVSLADGLPIGMPKGGYPLGIAPEIPDLEIATVDMPEAGILLFTDGLTDARPPGSSFQPFGESRISMFLRELDDPSPEEAVEVLSAAATRFAGGTLPDDLCLLALRSKFPKRWYRGDEVAAVVEITGVAAGDPDPLVKHGAS